MTDLATYRLDIYDSTGVFRGSLTGTAAGGAQNNAGFLSLSCLRRVNAPGALALPITRRVVWLPTLTVVDRLRVVVLSALAPAMRPPASPLMFDALEGSAGLLT